MAKTLRVRVKDGWITKPIENRPENRLSSIEIDDNFLELESQIELNYSELDGKIGSNYSELDGKIGSNYSELDGKINSNYSELIGVTSDIQTQLDDKAPLESPALTGTPTAPTAVAGDNTTQIANTAFVSNAVSSITELKGIATAWVNFNGTGTVAIRDSYNVSSITDNGVGNYTVNFLTPMSRTDYSIALGAGGVATTGLPFALANMNPAGAIVPPTTQGFALYVGISGAGGVDSQYVNASVFGGK